MVFEVGKYYRHLGTGELLHIIGEVTTSTLYGECLVGESNNCYDFLPIGKNEENTLNYEEISKDCWDRYWKARN